MLCYEIRREEIPTNEQNSYLCFSKSGFDLLFPLATRLDLCVIPGQYFYF